MTEEEKQELEQLRAKDTLTDEEVSRAAKLEKLEAEEEPLSDEDEFDQAFAEAIGDAPQKPDEEDTGTKSEQNDNDKDDNQDDSIFNKVPDTEDNLDDDGNDDLDSPQKKIAQLEADLAKEKQRTRSWEGRIEAANKRAEEAEKKLNDQTDQTGQDKKSPEDGEEDEVLSEFIEEFPSLEQPIKVLIKREGAKVARKIVEAELGKVTPDIRKVIETTEEEATEKHFDKIKKAHKDYLKIYESGALQTWIDNQPKFIQAGLNLIVEEGEADEIIEMLDAYKKAAKIVSSEHVNRKADSKKKLKSLEAVENQSGGPPKQKKKANKDDFDAGWDEAMKS